MDTMKELHLFSCSQEKKGTSHNLMITTTLLIKIILLELKFDWPKLAHGLSLQTAGSVADEVLDCDSASSTISIVYLFRGQTPVFLILLTMVS